MKSIQYTHDEHGKLHTVLDICFYESRASMNRAIKACHSKWVPRGQVPADLGNAGAYTFVVPRPNRGFFVRAGKSPMPLFYARVLFCKEDWCLEALAHELSHVFKEVHGKRANMKSARVVGHREIEATSVGQLTGCVVDWWNKRGHKVMGWPKHIRPLLKELDA